MLTTTNLYILRVLAGAAALMPALGVPGGGTVADSTPPTLAPVTTCIHSGDPGFRAALPSSGPAAVAVDSGFSVPGIGHPDPGFSVYLPACK
ncbi:MAG: hypothetical protein M3Z04_20535 [Chloroflexota bacterium]|nr:hypothetical protein [Chloroflexota bacterium]